MKTRYLILFLVSFFVAGIASAQQVTELIPVKSKALTYKAIDKSFTQLISRNEEIKTLSRHLIGKGYLPQKGIKNYYGMSETYRDKATKQNVTYTIMFQDYIKEGTGELAAVCQVKATSGGETETYNFYLDAGDGDFENMKEFYIDKKLNLLPANSWWSCTKNRVKNKCSTECLEAFVKCIPSGSGTIVGYLICVGTRCGGCLIKAGACCACDCRWWCKGFVGCCDR